MSSFINEFFIEINQYPRYLDEYGDLFTIKDYFHYDSNTKEYGYRDTVIPASIVENFNNIDDSVVRTVINNKVPIMKRVIDLNNQKETWIFQTSKLQGLDQK